MKIAINTCFGGFALSSEAVLFLKNKGLSEVDMLGIGLERTDPRLIEVIEKLGKKASAAGENIKIVEIPDDVKDWYIDDYDGVETVREGRIWSGD